ncbi:cupin domain-containing protein [Curtobacterium sp. MCPF17_052]|uniref:cupin domain-containing protein n=1 Tax=Curtobacterium sp. MCPF17_052 TaxID=2175655 RepID=UPI0024DF4EA2|nr:cupin domain-containing protein [Curtobacterium sp. MCPF17_052]WIB11323.1 cupin domain-containing protein [Curtobacterium sp. MCPF17_052]
MPVDRLSEVLDLIEVRGVVSGGSALRGRWHTRSVIDDDLKFIAVVRGWATLETEGGRGAGPPRRRRRRRPEREVVADTRRR